MKKKVKIGDYVLATKWSDGDPGDHFAVGFFKEYTWHNRYMVVDIDGIPFRGNGFRRVEKISEKIGKIICDNLDIIEKGAVSVWYWRYHPKQLKETAKFF